MIKFYPYYLLIRKKVLLLHRFTNAQMAESVDALVSNTSGFTSIPVRPRVWVQGESSKGFLLFFMPFFVDIGNDGIFVSYFLTE